MRFTFSFAFSRHYTQSPTSVVYHVHPVYEMVYYLEGTGYIGANGYQYAYRPGTVMVIRPNCMHDEVHYSPTTVICIGFEPADDGFCLADDVTSVSAVKDAALLSCAKRIVEETDHEWEYFEDQREALLASLLISFTRLLDGKSTPAERVIETGDILFHDQKSDSDVIAVWDGYMKSYADRSYDSFRREFKKRVGIAPAQFLLQLRIQKACQLLNTTTMNMTDISNACGFCNCSYFTQMFKKKIGVTPSHYRNRILLSKDFFKWDFELTNERRDQDE